MMTKESSLTRPTWFKKILERLEYLSELGDNWNGYGEKAIQQSCINTVLRILSKLENGYPEFDIIPTSEGGLLIEWSFLDVELEIPPEGDIIIFAANDTGVEINLERSDTDAIIRNLTDHILI